MNLLVCVKQVPDTTEIRVDPVRNTLIRDGVPSILNPFDGFALEAAARIKDRFPDTKITAITMGPPQAVAVLRECLSTAADRAFLVSGRPFGGSDTLSTSYILSHAVAKLEQAEGKPFDIIFCGKQAIDGDTAQVGPELAEHLDRPQVTCATEVSPVEDGLSVCRQTDDEQEIIHLSAPCVLTFTKSVHELRAPSIRRRLLANRTRVPIISDADLTDIDLTRVGLSGSPTRVKKTFVAQRTKGNCVRIQGETAEQEAKQLYELLSSSNIF